LKWLNRSKCSRDAPVLYPFTDPSCYEKFSKREAHLRTPAFEEAIALAAEYSQSEQSELRRLQVMNLLMMGASERKKLIEYNKLLAEIRQTILEENEAKAARKQIILEEKEARAARKRTKVHSMEQGARSHKKQTQQSVSAKPPRCDDKAGDAATSSALPSCTSRASSKPSLIGSAPEASK
jgi:hypothetical protein